MKSQNPDKIDILLRFFYEIVNSNPEDVLENTKHLQSEIEDLRNKIEKLIDENLKKEREDENSCH